MLNTKRILQIIHTPKVQLALSLLLIYFTAIITEFSPNIIYIFITNIAFTVGFDLLFIYIRKRKVFIPYAAIVTGLILSVTLTPTTPWYAIIILCGIAMATKNFIRIKNRHIFNPAAIGLVLGGIIFHQSVSWWGSSFQSIFTGHIGIVFLFIILLLPIYVSGYRMKRYYTIFSFFLVYIITSFFLTHGSTVQDFVAISSSSSLIFFTLIMLPEPMTSPVTKKRQILFGMLVAILTQIILLPMISHLLAPIGLLPDPFLISLLISNAIFFTFR